MFGLLERDIVYIKKAISQFNEIEKVIIFGSRAIGNYKKGSDIDLAIIGKRVTRKTILRLNEDLNEVYPLPYFFDIVHYNSLSNEELKSHIDTQGKLIYEN